jgi:Flp pilus assembly protein protease CpaA
MCDAPPVRDLVPRPWLVAGLVLLVAGIVLAAVGDHKLDVAGFGVGGAGAIVLVGLAFYAVGRSEDRDREQRPSG